jgi:hypothetical protein
VAGARARGVMLRFIPSKAALWAALSAAAALLLAWLRLDARRDARRDAEIKDYEHAENIEDRVSADRVDPDRLRPFEGAGYRD